MKFSQKESDFMESMEEARLATSHEDIPHVKPVSFVFQRDSIIVATDYKTRSFSNIIKNQKVGVSVDTYSPGQHKAVCIQGYSEIIEEGKEFKEMYMVFHEKFEWVRKDPWGEKEAPFIRITPTNIVSWGLD